MIGSFASPFAHQPYPFLQPQQQVPPGYGVPQAFTQQSQSSALPLQQVLHSIALQVNQLSQQNQQQSNILQQLAHIVPQQLQQIQQFLHVVPQLIHQASTIQQPFGSGAGTFGPWQQAFGGTPWSNAGIPQQYAPAGQIGPGPHLGFPSPLGQSGPVM